MEGKKIETGEMGRELKEKGKGGKLEKLEKLEKWVFVKWEEGRVLRMTDDNLVLIKGGER